MSDSMKPVEIKILGSSFQLMSDNPDQLKRASEIVSNHFDEIQDQISSFTEKDRALLLSLSIAEELLGLRQDHLKFKTKVEKDLAHLIDLMNHRILNHGDAKSQSQTEATKPLDA